MIKLKPSILSMSPKSGVIFITNASTDEGVMKVENVGVDFYEYIKALPDSASPPDSPDIIEYLTQLGYQGLERDNVLKDFHDFVGNLKKFNFLV